MFGLKKSGLKSEDIQSAEPTTSALADDVSQSEVKHNGPNTSCWLDLEYLQETQVRLLVFGRSQVRDHGDATLLSDGAFIGFAVSLWDKGPFKRNFRAWKPTILMP